ncbi:hypothetical protein LTR99_009611 [Exophiala xenobiotica]|uniref:Major facilitator superfamily (MFS) profile domain-containing protein n=1 Tax=Vermiconidia calcicola TaxID=1690605 RepID=A0AAV9PYJ1_9PEZI|nr:hypothetical protein LTR92_007810 [Exophiala xenobiotica]KAK5530449.1 hypothetical protein LTR25_009027 [Vermiconidia calcicola]KAK5539110.1 hypothetical protein LTR23_006924 [Chaetothyriales sp. CCFEE 6169]KAK5205492.1 hypothetical protein LTR41_008946 [Exophiala xenobiotica]KAK5216223.1 hypothetical protein LTR72_010794 [Exophiala xenobiotica]
MAGVPEIKRVRPQHEEYMEDSPEAQAIHEKELRDAEALRELAPDIPLREALEAQTAADQIRLKKIMRKVDFRQISILALVYIWAYIDRSNLGNVNIAGMRDDLDTNVGNRYSVLTMVFFIGYPLVDIPAMYLTRKVGPALWIGSIGVAWSVITIGQGFCHSWTALAVCRALLGLLEGGLVPGVLYLLGCWYTRYEIGTRIAAFYVIGIMSAGISGLLAYGLEKMDGTAGIRGWRWIFIIEGVISGVVALASYFLIIDFPEKAAKKNSLGLPRFLTPEEAALVLARIEHDRGDAVEEKLTWNLFISYIKDWKLWEFSLYLLLNNAALYAFAYFLPVILKDGFGYSTAKAQVMTFPPYLVGGVWMVICGVLGDKLRTRGPIMIANCVIFIVGIVMVVWCTGTRARYAGVFIGQMGTVGNIPLQWAYAHNNLVGQLKKGLAMAMMTMGGAFSGIIAGNAFRSQDAPGYRPGLWMSIAFNILYGILIAKNIFLFRRQNRRADRGEIVLLGQPGFRYTL